MMKNRNPASRIRRRTTLGGAAVAGAGLLLRAIATGLPTKILLDPLSASAADMPDPNAKVLILSCSDLGDPITCNVPGTYELDGVVHPGEGLSQTTPMKIGDRDYEVPEIWRTYLEETDLGCHETIFFHHATGTPIHGDMDRVQRIMDKTSRSDMLISLLAAKLAERQGAPYLQSAPLSLGANRGSELITTQGRMLSNVTPLGVKQALLGTEGELSGLAKVRDEDMKRLSELYRTRGTPAQLELLDAWDAHREALKSANFAQALLEALAKDVESNDAAGQVVVAAVLAAMKLAPVITIHIPCGGDNHGDQGLLDEAVGHVGSPDAPGAIALLTTLRDKLAAYTSLGGKKASETTLSGVLNIFGRTLATDGGRNHNMDHNVLILTGPGIEGGVIGGIQKTDKDFGATGIDPKTGAIGTGIAVEDSLASAGKTMGYALGITRDELDEMLPSGQVVDAAVTGTH